MWMDTRACIGVICSFYTCISMLVLVQDYVYVVFEKELIDHMTT